MARTRNRILFLLTLTTLAGCQSEPLPADAVFNEEKPARMVGCSVYAFDVPQVMEFTIGQEKSYTVVGTLPESAGLPVYEAFDLPDGAVFDRAAGKVTWEKPVLMVADPLDPTATGHVHIARFTLGSSNDPNILIQKKAVFVVKAATE